MARYRKLTDREKQQRVQFYRFGKILLAIVAFTTFQSFNSYIVATVGHILENKGLITMSWEPVLCPTKEYSEREKLGERVYVITGANR